jgi:Zn-dependent protease with chaperone function
MGGQERYPPIIEASLLRCFATCKCSFLGCMEEGMQRILLFLMAIFVLIVPPVHALGYEKEREVSQEFISLLEARGLIIHNADVIWMLQSVTDLMADHIKEPVYSFKIYLINDKSINAMAIPDGNIFLNLGTVLVGKDMDEIASVIGHEMGHCQMRHFSEAMEVQKRITTASLVGILAGILLSSSSPEVGSALIFSSLGGGENLKLQYSRKQELEADEFGRNLMGASGMDPAAMSRFLVRLRTYADSPNIPQYLLTHPYTQDRIAAVEKEPTPPHPETRFWTLYASILGELLPEEEVQARIQSMPEPFGKLAWGISKVRTGKNKEGLVLLEGIDLPLAKGWKGLALYGIGEKDKAYPYLLGYQRNAAIGIAVAEILSGKGQIDEAITTLLPYRDNPRAAYTLGTLYEKKGNTGLSHVSFARYFFSMQNYKASLFHINKALEEKSLGADLSEAMKQMKETIQKVQRSN